METGSEEGNCKCAYPSHRSEHRELYAKGEDILAVSARLWDSFGNIAAGAGVIFANYRDQ